MTAIIFIFFLLFVLYIPTTLVILNHSLLPFFPNMPEVFPDSRPVYRNSVFKFHEAFFWPHIFWELADRIILGGE
jgi:hypothetical protein